MAVKTSTFSGWRLSGKEAKAFKKQISTAAPNPRAQAALVQGRKLMKEYSKKGCVVLSVAKKVSKNKTR